MTNNKSSQKSKSSAGGFLFVFMTVALDMLAIGIIIPILPNLVKNFAGGDIENAARITGFYATGAALGQFIAMPIIGGLSDQFGRKPIFLVSNFGQSVALALSALAPNLVILFLSRLLAGMLSGSVSTAYAYIADTEEPHNRAAKFGILGVAFGIGFVIGPALGGYLGGVELHLPLWLAAGIAFANGIFGYFFLKESLPKEMRTKFSLAKANPFGTFKFFKENKQIIGFSIIKLLNDLAHVVLPATFVLYADYRYGWGTQQTGIMLALIGVASMIVQGGMVRPIVKYFGEKKALFVGLIAGSISFAIYGLANTPTLIYAAIPIAAFWGLHGAASQAYLTSKVHPNEQGRLQGALSSLTALMGIIGPYIFTQIFAHFISDKIPVKIPGMQLFFSSFLVFIALLVAIKVTKKEPNKIIH